MMVCLLMLFVMLFLFGYAVPLDVDNVYLGSGFGPSTSRPQAAASSTGSYRAAIFGCSAPSPRTPRTKLISAILQV